MSGLPLRLIQPKILIVLFCLACSAPVYAEDAEWYEPFFIEAAGQYYFSPGFFSEVISPGFGFRGALGYEYNRFRFALESGYNHITGTDPHVLELDFTPLVFKFGYALPLFSIFGLQADLGAGVAFVKTLRYQTAIDLAMDKVLEDSENSFIAGGRFYATVTPLRFLRIYAGGGIDVILEKEGPLPLPLVEVGIHFKPFALAGSRPERRPQTAIYFEANAIYIKEDSLPKLDEAGRRLQDNPLQKLTLCAYYAPDGIELQVNRLNGDPALSCARAEWCALYLLENYGIAAERVTIEHRDAGSRNELYRCIEIIIR
jgi:hypothetical protein